MNAYRMLLAQIALERRLAGEVWGSALLMAVAIGAIGLTLGVALPRAPGAGIAAGLTGITVLIWWSVYLPNAFQQNRPTLSALVPGLRRKLMGLTAAVWATGSLIPALVHGAMAGYFGYVFIGTAVFLLFVALCNRYVWLALAPGVILLSSLLLGDDPIARVIAALDTWGELNVTLVGLALLLPAGWLTLILLFPCGGDGHFRWGDVAARRAQNLKNGLTGMTGFGSPGNRLERPFDLFYLAGGEGAGRPCDRVLDGLGPRAHWSRPVTMIVLTTAIVLACDAWFGDDRLRPLVPLILVSFILTVGMFVKTMLTALKETPVEQGVLRLVSIAPPVAQLNRDLAATLLRRFFIVWTVAAVSGAIVVWAIVHSWGGWAFCTAVTLTLVPVLLRDQARDPGWQSSTLAMGAALLLVPSLAGVLDIGPLPALLVPVLVVLILVGTAIIARRRWHAMLAAPPALPAGRFAE